MGQNLLHFSRGPRSFSNKEETNPQGPLPRTDSEHSVEESRAQKQHLQWDDVDSKICSNLSASQRKPKVCDAENADSHLGCLAHDEASLGTMQHSAKVFSQVLAVDRANLALRLSSSTESL